MRGQGKRKLTVYLVSPLSHAAEAVDVLAAHEDAKDPVLHLPKLSHFFEADAALRASRLPSRRPSDREGGGGRVERQPNSAVETQHRS